VGGGGDTNFVRKNAESYPKNIYREKGTFAMSNLGKGGRRQKLSSSNHTPATSQGKGKPYQGIPYSNRESEGPKGALYSLNRSRVRSKGNPKGRPFTLYMEGTAFRYGR